MSIGHRKSGRNRWEIQLWGVSWRARARPWRCRLLFARDRPVRPLNRFSVACTRPPARASHRTSCTAIGIDRPQRYRGGSLGYRVARRGRPRINLVEKVGEAEGRELRSVGDVLGRHFQIAWTPCHHANYFTEQFSYMPRNLYDLHAKRAEHARFRRQRSIWIIGHCLGEIDRTQRNDQLGRLIKGVADCPSQIELEWLALGDLLKGSLLALKSQSSTYGPGCCRFQRHRVRCEDACPTPCWERSDCVQIAGRLRTGGRP
jgi:hypothetical protein